MHNRIYQLCPQNHMIYFRNILINYINSNNLTNIWRLNQFPITLNDLGIIASNN